LEEAVVLLALRLVLVLVLALEQLEVCLPELQQVAFLLVYPFGVAFRQEPRQEEGVVAEWNQQEHRQSPQQIQNH